MWYKGGRGRTAWAKPISVQLELEQEEARAAQQRQRLAEYAENDRIREEARKDSVRARTDELAVVRAARQNALGTMVAMNAIQRAMHRVAQDVAAYLVDPQNSGKLSPEKLVGLLERSARATRQATEAGHRALTMERMLAGRPTDILGITEVQGPVAIEEAREDIEAGLRALERVKAGQALTVIEGGVGAGRKEG
jgi:hypothetical protein